jgi:hypothetical protein
MISFKKTWNLKFGYVHLQSYHPYQLLSPPLLNWPKSTLQLKGAGAAKTLAFDQTTTRFHGLAILFLGKVSFCSNPNRPTVCKLSRIFLCLLNIYRMCLFFRQSTLHTNGISLLDPLLTRQSPGSSSRRASSPSPCRQQFTH